MSSPDRSAFKTRAFNYLRLEPACPWARDYVPCRGVTCLGSSEYRASSYVSQQIAVAMIYMNLDRLLGKSRMVMRNVFSLTN